MLELSNFMEVDSGVDANKALNSIPCFKMELLRNPDAVLGSAYSKFLGSKHRNLLVNKGTNLVIYNIDSEGLSEASTIPINGKISQMAIIRQPTEIDTDVVVILTEKRQLLMLQSSTNSKGQTDISILDWVEISETARRPVEGGPFMVVEPSGKFIALHLVQGLLKLIPLIRKDKLFRFQSPSDHRIGELVVRQMVLLTSTSKSVYILGLLCEGHDYNSRHCFVSTYQISIENLSSHSKAILPSSWSLPSLDQHTQIIIPLPLPRSGLLVISPDNAIYNRYPNSSIQSQLTISFEEIGKRVTCYDIIDANGFRVLIAGDSGKIVVIFCITSSVEGKECVTELRAEILGKTSIPSTIAYLDKGHVYVGSEISDSVVIQLSKTRLPCGSFLKLMQKFAQISPVIDFLVDDRSPKYLCDHDTTGKIIANACAYDDGSIAMLTSGINMTSFAKSNHFNGVSQGWISEDNLIFLENDQQASIQAYRFSPNFDDHEVILDPIGNSMKAENSAKILLAGAFNGVSYIVSDSMVKLDDDSKEIWNISDDRQIVKASSLKDWLAIALDNGMIFILQMTPSGIQERKNFAVDECNGSISCMSISSEGLLAICLWTGKIFVQNIIQNSKSLEFFLCDSEDTIRTIAVAKLVQENLLIVGLSNGAILYDTFNNLLKNDGNLSFSKRLKLANDPICALVFLSEESNEIIFHTQKAVFLCTINIGKDILQFAKINIPFENNGVFCYMLAQSKKNAARLLILYQESSRMQILSGYVNRKVTRTLLNQPVMRILNETVRRLSKVASSNTELFVALTTNSQDSCGTFYLLSDDSLNVIDSFRLPAGELGQSIHSSTFHGREVQHDQLVVVGTVILPDDKDCEPDKGRILTFSICNSSGVFRLRLVHQFYVPGCVYSLSSLRKPNSVDDERLLVASINGSTFLYQLCRQSVSLTNESIFPWEWKKLDHISGQVLGLHLDSFGSYVSVGDVMRSVSMLEVVESELEDRKTRSYRLVELARSYACDWVTAICQIDDATVMVGDVRGNLLIYQRRPDPLFSETSINSNAKRQKLILLGGVHLGHRVSRIKKDVIHGSIIVASTSGMILRLVPCSRDILKDIQEKNSGILPLKKFRQLYSSSFSSMSSKETVEELVVPIFYEVD